MRVMFYMRKLLGYRDLPSNLMLNLNTSARHLASKQRMIHLLPLQAPIALDLVSLVKLQSVQRQFQELLHAIKAGVDVTWLFFVKKE